MRAGTRAVSTVAVIAAAGAGTRLAAAYSSGIPGGAREDWEALDDEGEPDEPTRKRRRLEQHLATLGAITGKR